MKNKLKINNLQIRNSKEKNPNSSTGIASWHTSALTPFIFYKKNLESRRLKNGERKKQIRMPFCSCTCLGKAFILKLKGHKELSDLKKLPQTSSKTLVGR